MTDAIRNCSANETAARCCVADRQAAEAMLAELSAKARQVESDPCEIHSRFTDEADGVRLDVDFTFACQAETLIFQLGLR